ncbi:hypothetical protein KC19_11G164200 [Ceratodon purpureus]|uniref:Uncharacterized protein n=1 Tax=Ceratodon purpureus TaxID=3225 RepID=A0A8T0GH03_CERPU|nr:hypothetical protein KC19_11G164200 [Ceratodon purpureus]
MNLLRPGARSRTGLGLGLGHRTQVQGVTGVGTVSPECACSAMTGSVPLMSPMPRLTLHFCKAIHTDKFSTCPFRFIVLVIHFCIIPSAWAGSTTLCLLFPH